MKCTWDRAAAGAWKKFSRRKGTDCAPASRSWNWTLPNCERAAILPPHKLTPPFTTLMRNRRSWNSCATTRGVSRICSSAKSFLRVTRSAQPAAARAQEKNVAAAQMRVAQARAQLADIDAQLAEMQVVAPTDSILEVLSVKVGDVLPANREVATLILPQHLWVRVFVPEPWLGLIKVGEAVRVRVDSFPGKDFAGTVEQINRQAEFTPRNVQTVEDRIKQVFGVKIRLPNDDERLRAGMAADVYFPNVKMKMR